MISALTADKNTTADYPTSIDGFTAIIMMTGEATVSIDMQNYSIKPNTIVFFNPDSIIRTIKCSSNAAAYLLAFSKSFVNEIQIDLSTSLPVYMRFGKAPVLEVTPQDVDEIRQLFQLIKTMLRSDKERYRHEIIRTLFTTAFYIITEINQREQPGEMKQGRCEVLFDEFMSLLQQYNKRERNVSFYAKQLNITPKYLSSVVKEVSGKTAARWIDESVILEAKALLKYSGAFRRSPTTSISRRSPSSASISNSTPEPRPRVTSGKDSFRFYRASSVLPCPARTENTFVCPVRVELCQDKIRSSKIKKPNLVFQVAARGCPL